MIETLKDTYIAVAAGVVMVVLLAVPVFMFGLTVALAISTTPWWLLLLLPLPAVGAVSWTIFDRVMEWD